MKNERGFTLIELLVVIGILAVLLGIVLIAINPAKQFGQADDTKRRSDVGAILNAIGAYAADKKGVLPGGIPVDPAPAADIGTIAACAQIMPDYISAVPMDPLLANNEAGVTACSATSVTNYKVVQKAGRVTVTATSAVTPPISVTR